MNHSATRAALALTLTLALAGAAASAQPDAQRGVATVLLRPGTAGNVYQLDGVVQPVKQSTVAAQASGRVATLAVKAGDRVKAGQVLAVVDDREAQVSVQRSQAQISQADAEVRTARAHLERSKDLQSKGFVSRAALDTAAEQFNVASAARDQALAGARQTALAQNFTRVTAPFDGWVLQTHVQAGDLAVPGAPVVTIYAPQPLRVVVQVPGSRVQAVRQATGHHHRAGRRRPAGRAAFNPWRALPFLLPTRFRRPPSGAWSWPPRTPPRCCRASPCGCSSAPVSPKRGPAHLTVPASAVVRRGELSAVYVATPTGFALRAVRTGASVAGNDVELLSGVRAGESVARDAIRAGYPGAKPLPLNQ